MGGNEKQLNLTTLEVLIFWYPAEEIVPYLRFPNKVDTVTWTWNQPHSALAVLWLTLSQPFTRAEVEYLPPYHPSQEERAGIQFNGIFYLLVKLKPNLLFWKGV